MQGSCDLIDTLCTMRYCRGWVKVSNVTLAICEPEFAKISGRRGPPTNHFRADS